MIDKIRGIFGTQPVDKVRQQKTEVKERKDKADGVEVSPFAKELAAASAEMKKNPRCAAREGRTDQKRNRRRNLLSRLARSSAEAFSGRHIERGQGKLRLCRQKV